MTISCDCGALRRCKVCCGERLASTFGQSSLRTTGGRHGRLSFVDFCSVGRALGWRQKALLNTRNIVDFSICKKHVFLERGGRSIAQTPWDSSGDAGRPTFAFKSRKRNSLRRPNWAAGKSNLRLRPNTKRTLSPRSNREKQAVQAELLSC